MKPGEHRASAARRTLLLAVMSVLLGALLSNISEEATTRPAALILQLLKYGTPREHFLDEQGVPRLRYTRLGPQLYYNPVYVAIYGLYYHDRWQRNGENAYFLRLYHIYPPSLKGAVGWFDLFLASADWLVQNLQVHEHNGIRYGVYEYDFPWPVYKLRPPWRSAMAQGLSMQVLARAWVVTHDSTYLHAAILARNALDVEVRDGGVTYKDTPNAWWYEEYASADASESRVLNGMAHVLVALREFYAMTGDTSSVRLFGKGMESLSRSVRAYRDSKVAWTDYDRLGTLANRKYHEINVNLIRRLFALTGVRELYIWREWEALDEPFLVREFVRQRPHPIDVVIVCLNTTLAMVILVVLAGLLQWLRSRFRVWAGQDVARTGL